MSTMSTRILVLAGLLISLAAFCGGCGPDAGSGGGARPVAPPNVVFIVMDTAGAERCSVNGHDRPTTPNLEKIAAEGINFRNTWSPSGWTAPAHASMFTGLRPEHHGLYHRSREYLPEQFTTLAELLQGAGYATGCFTNNSFVTPDHGLSAGFEHFVPLFERENRQYPLAVETHDLALDWVLLQKRKGRPWFLFINDMEPHLLYEPPREYADRFVGPDQAEAALAAGLDMTPDVILKHNLGTVPLPPYSLSVIPDLYDAEIACLDHEIGLFFENLREGGHLEHTLVVITSDHGENLGRHGLLDHKFSLHRPLLYVPLVIRLPDGSRAGEVRDEVVRLEDLFPTILELCGLPIPADIDGQTLLGDVSGRIARAMRFYPEKFLNHMEAAMGGRAGYEKVMVDLESEFDGRFHRIRYSDGRRLVFDVLADPEELHPLDE
jgi:arylsulfatase A-like enzyme